MADDQEMTHATVPAVHDWAEKDKKSLTQLRARVTRARNFPHNTCPASRHVQMMGDYLPRKVGYPMLQEEPTHCAISLLATVAALYEARTELAELRESIAATKAKSLLSD